MENEKIDEYEGSSSSYSSEMNRVTDIKIENADLSTHGKKILENANFTIVENRIYGLVGRNGIGKSTLLKAIRKRRLGKCGSIYLVRQEEKFMDMSVLEYVKSDERIAKKINGDCINNDASNNNDSNNNDSNNNNGNNNASKNNDSNNNANILDYEDTKRLNDILTGIGFTFTSDTTKKITKSVHTNIKNLSGGWMVRANLAKALFNAPDLLLLDEPTNMLDIPTIVFLGNKLKELNKTMIIVSHDREFLNTVCTDILHLDDLKIKSYTGNYTSFLELRKQERNLQKKAYEKQKADREHLQAFIDKFRYNAKRASLAQSKIKILEGMTLIKPVKNEIVIKFKFRCGEGRGTLIECKNVDYTYDKIDEDSKTITSTNNIVSDSEVLKNVNLKITDKSRIVIVGPNGAGKSTLLKMLASKIDVKTGTIIKNPNLKIGYFTQHHIDHLRMDESVLGFIMKQNDCEETCRKAMAGFGLIADRQKIGSLSGGQKSRLAFSVVSLLSPNLLLLDEPTNHLDIESIDGLGEALKNYEGAVVCVSHDLAFVESVGFEVWVCKDQEVTYYKGGIREYRDSLMKK
ncbi:ATP-binding cassette [Binucleata daphniae]